MKMYLYVTACIYKDIILYNESCYLDKIKVTQCYDLFEILFRQFSEYRQPELGNLDLPISGVY